MKQMLGAEQPGRRAARPAWPAVKGGVVLGILFLVSACSAVPDWADPSTWFEDTEAPSRLSGARETAQAQGDSFPELSSVPEKTPSATPQGARAQIAQGLAADRTNAQYTGDRLVGDTTAAQATPPAAPPVPKIARQLSPVSPQPAAATPAPPVKQVLAAKQPAAPAPAQAPKRKSGPLRLPQFQTSAVPKATPQTPARRDELAAIIYFANGSFALDNDDRAVLRDVVALSRERGATIRVIGHASAHTGVVDPVRRRMANLEISQKRANAVMAALRALGAPRDKVRAEARSDSQPVYHEFMPTGEAGNRRAEIFLEY